MDPTSCGSPAPSARPLADWARAADGIQLAGFAVFLLLNTSGLLPWSFWLDAITLWPVLVISAGIKIAFEKTRAPWLLLLGPALVLGTLTWVAAGSRPDLLAGPWTPAPVARPAGVSRVRLETHLAGARLAVTATDVEPALLVDGRFVARDPGGRLKLSPEGEVARVELRGGWRKGFVVFPGNKQRWDLRLPAELPLDFRLDGVMVRGGLDLSRGHLARASMHGVFLGLDLNLPATSEPVLIKVNGVFNVVNVTVPEGTPVVVGGAGPPFNVVKRRLPGAEGRAGYEVNVEGIFSVVTLDTRPATAQEAAPPPAPGPRPKPEAEPGALPSSRPEAAPSPKA